MSTLKPQSATPRTDAVQDSLGGDCCSAAHKVVLHARELERELAALKELSEQQRFLIGELDDGINWHKRELAALKRSLAAQAERIATLHKIHASHEIGRCYQCGWSLKASIEEGCVIGNCSYRPSERAPDYEQWRERTDKARAALAAEGERDVSRPFTIRELMWHDLKQATWQAWKAVTDPWPHYSHWKSVGLHLRSCMVRPYYGWRHHLAEARRRRLAIVETESSHDD